MMRKRISNIWYRCISYAAFSLLTILTFSVQLMIHMEVSPDTGLSVLTGGPRVVAASDVLRLRFKSPLENLILTFNEPLAGQVFQDADSSNRQYQVLWDSDSSYSIRVQSRNPVPEELPEALSSIRFSVARLFDSVEPTDRELVSATVDGRAVSGFLFLTEMLVRHESSLTLYYPMALQNISHEIARLVGDDVLKGILFVLIVLMGSQAVLLLSSRWAPAAVKRYFDTQESSRVVTFVDRFANEYSIPLGLLGTISAIWVALERPAGNFTSFDQIISILRIAIFTTVLGLATKLICMVRGRFSQEIVAPDE